jgi:hypothetical protein
MAEVEKFVQPFDHVALSGSGAKTKKPWSSPQVILGTVGGTAKPYALWDHGSGYPVTMVGPTS